MINTDIYSLRLPITKISYYQRVLKLGQENPQAIFLDLGCCCAPFLPLPMLQFPHISLYQLGTTSEKPSLTVGQQTE